MVGRLHNGRVSQMSALGVLEGDREDEAVTVAARQVAAVRDDPGARLALAGVTYRGPTGRAPHHLPFRRAALSFMRWEVLRGALNPVEGDRPGSLWWRALNERLLRDGCEAVARAGGRGGRHSSSTIALWGTFVRTPTARHWYRAHNASIVAAYLEHRDLAELESRAERFFLNVVLLRVLYAHALVGAPSLALGRCGSLGRLLGDPRLGMAGAFLSLGRVLPAQYPIRRRLEDVLPIEHDLGRMLDYAVIQPRLTALYEWSAEELGQPGLRALIHDGVPAYVWPHEERGLWDPPALSLAARILGVATSARVSRPGRVGADR